MQYLVVMGPINGGRWFGAVTYHASEIHGAVLVYEHLWFSNDRRDRFWTIENKGKYDSPYVIISLRIEQKQTRKERCETKPANEEGNI